MRTILKMIAGIIILMFVLGMFMQVIVWAFAETSNSGTAFVPNIKREDYLAIAEARCRHDVELNAILDCRCAYADLIDTHGVEETYNMDKRVDVDENDVDPRLFTSMAKCMK